MKRRAGRGRFPPAAGKRARAPGRSLESSLYATLRRNAVAGTTVMTLIVGACLSAPPPHDNPNQPAPAAVDAVDAVTALDEADPVDPIEDGRQLRLAAARAARADRAARAAAAESPPPVASASPSASPPAVVTAAAPGGAGRRATRRAAPEKRRRPGFTAPQRAAPNRAPAGRARPPRQQRPARPPTVGFAPAPAGAAGAVVAFALAQVGHPYRHAASGPDAFDCSGLAMAAYARIGVSLPHQTGGIAGRGRPVSRAELRPGDLVFTDPGHVGIYIGGGQMVHASTERGGVKRSDVYRFAFARRIVG